MAKEFAFLFYVNDWAGGTQWMSRLQRGAYLDLLLYQVNNTSLSIEEVKAILGDDFSATWPILKQKFAEKDGRFFNQKMRNVLEARLNFTNSRRNNRLGKTKNTSSSLVKLVGKEKEREEVIELEDRKINFINSLEPFLTTYGQQMLKAFAEYWTEHNPKGKKMRFEMQKVFDVARRLKTWSSNNYNKPNGNKHNEALERFVRGD